MGISGFPFLLKFPKSFFGKAESQHTALSRVMLSQPLYKNIIVESIRYCQKENGLQLHGWIIISNHVHLIASTEKVFLLPGIMRDFKKYTSKQIDQAISENPFESRKEWMLWIACLAKSAGFNRAGQRNSNNKNFQFWQQDNHPFELHSNDMLQQEAVIHA